MAKINQALLERLATKLCVQPARVYALIQQRAVSHRVRRHIAALLLAGENGISVQKYATDEELTELHGAPHQAPPAVSIAGPGPSRPTGRKAANKRLPRSKENTVFVVHGRDAALRDAMYEFVGAIGLKSLEWGHAIRNARGNGGNPFVNDVVTRIMDRAQAIIVMLSADDEVKLKSQFVTKSERATEGKLRGQARPNVIFETGIAIGAHHKKTLIVQAGDVKPFTDIGGMHVMRLSNSDHSRHNFANRLRDLGCKINTDGDHWLRAGNFTPTQDKKATGRRNS